MKKKKIDTTNEGQAYWEKILVQEGFSMDRGGPSDSKHRHAVAIYLEDLETEALKDESELSGFEIITISPGLEGYQELKSIEKNNNLPRK